MIKINNLGNKVVVEGNIKSIEHYNQLKSTVDEMLLNSKTIVVTLVDSISLTSSIIGYFTKIINVNGVVLELYVSDDGLFDLLDDLGLIQLFNVKRLRHDN